MSETDFPMAATHLRTPDGIVPTRVAGYIVEECTVLCADCGRQHPDVKPHAPDTALHDYTYDYIDACSEWDAPGPACESCHDRLNVSLIFYDD